jgi:outer membrane lipoprotein carrier protein
MQRFAHVPAPRRRFVAALVSLVAVAAAGPLAAQTAADGQIDRAVAAWAKVKTIRGTFEQTVTNPLVGTSATSHGEYAEERPNRLSIRFSPPMTDAIVADGRYTWVYLPTSAPGQVIRRLATDRASTPIDLTGQFLDEPRAKYAIRAAGTRAIDGRPSHGFTLTPKPGVSAPFSVATVWIDDGDSLIREFEENESGGVVRHVHLTAVETNVPVERSTFSFSVPPGVRVLDRPED